MRVREDHTVVVNDLTSLTLSVPGNQQYYGNAEHTFSTASSCWRLASDATTLVFEASAQTYVTRSNQLPHALNYSQILHLVAGMFVAL